MGFGWDDLLGIPTGGLYNAAKAAGGGYSKSGGEWGQLGSDYMNVGKNKYQGQAYQTSAPQWGGEGGADRMTGIGLGRMGSADQGQAWAQREAQRNRGAQAFENQELSNREAASRYGDQSGAIQLAREGAMGLAPSQAAYQLQAGLDRGLAQQSAIAGSARGGAGIALAGANANAAAGAMQNQAFTEGGRLRAQEMADYTNMYGNLSTQQRQQDQNRLQMGNQMSQFNASQNDNYKLGMAGAANQYGQTGLGWYNASQNPYNQQGQLDSQANAINADSYNQNEARKAGVAQANADARRSQTDRLWALGGTALGIGGSMIPKPGGGGGGGGKP